MDLETVSHFGIQNHRKTQKSAKVGPRRLPEWTVKVVEMDNWTSRCLLGVPVAPWTTKMVTQDTKLMNKWTKWNRSKTQMFLLGFTHIQPLHSGIISIPGSPKTWTWKLSPILAPKIMEKSQNLSKVGPRKFPKSIQKSIKMEIWASVRPVGVPLDPRITKMVSRATKKEPQGLQNDSFG